MFTQSYTYQDIGIVPTRKATAASRNNVVTESNFLGYSLELPILVAPMRHVVNTKLATTVRKLGGLAIMPRTYLSNPYPDSSCDFNQNAVPTISLRNAEKDLKSLLAFFPRVNALCIDAANGYHQMVADVVQEIRKWDKEIKIIAGNIGSVEGYLFLSNFGVDAVRVGIGSGAGCTTSIATGIGVGQASLIREIATYRASCNKGPLIIADGGIKQPGDLVKAIALGADIVMAGFLFAGCEEAPGEVIKFQGRKYKQYAGEASFAVKREHRYVEGEETLVPYSGPISSTWYHFEDGLRSAMAYLNAQTLDELRYLPDSHFRLLSDAAKLERLPQ